MEHRSWNDTTAADVISDILKMKEYAECASDTKVKQFFEKGAQSAMQNKQQLMEFLQ